MKSSLTKVCLALLSTAFLLSCQDLGSGPVGPDGLVPQFDKPVKTDEQCLALGRVLDETGHCHAGDDRDPVVDPGTLFISPGVISPPGVIDVDDVGHTCSGGALKTSGTSRGTVNFNQPRGHSHMHANVQLRGAPLDVYDIKGNHDVACLAGRVDFLLRSGHATTVTVGANGKGKARIGLDFGGPDPPAGGDAAHAEGPHNLWLTFVGQNTGTVLRSTAITVVIPFHDDH